MGAISPIHLVFVLVIALLVIGPGKLPETGAAIGKAIRQFREASSDTDTPPDAATDPHPPVAS